MKQIVYGTATILVLAVLLSGFIFCIKVYQNYSNKQYITQYYQDTISGKYEEAFNHLQPWNQKPGELVNISADGVKAKFLHKAAELKNIKYKIVKVDNISLTDEGAALGAQVNLTIQVNGRTKKVREHLDFYNAKIVIMESQDPYVHYRDGKISN